MVTLPCLEILASAPDFLNIIGHDTHIIATHDIEVILEQAKEHFEMQYFTLSERSVADAINRIHYFAGRFCAKKAVLKALKMETNQDIWLDIEVQRLPTGEPSVVLHGKCREIASEIGLIKLLLSISHVSSYAAASVIALGGARVTVLS